MSSSIGNRLCVTLFGESHGSGIGVVVDGFPPGFKLDMGELRKFMKRRSPGNDDITSLRKEQDTPVILSGVLNDITCGTPIGIFIKNNDKNSKDYEDMYHILRPGHADYTASLRYKGYNDIRGGGHSSGRLTASLCAAGGICLQYLEAKGIYIAAHLYSVENIYDDRFDMINLEKEKLKGLTKKNFPVINSEIESIMRSAIKESSKKGDSIGGIVEVGVTNFPKGIGSPIFSTVEGRLSYGYFGIPSVKGVEFGKGFMSSMMTGSKCNDTFIMNGNNITMETNNHGGILGGISTGMPIIARLAFKPTPSISQVQRSVDLEKGCNTELKVKGRHDPCVAIRAVPVVEAVTAIVLMDMLLEQCNE